MNETVVEIIRSYSQKFPGSKVFTSPDIPSKKLKNAIKAYAHELSEEDVLFLMDTTIFGSAKDGLLMNEDTLYIHRAFADRMKIAIKDIQSISLEEDDAAELELMDIHVNDPQLRSIAILNETEARSFAQMLQEIKAVWMPEGELVVKVIARESRISQPRLVPVEGGRLRRYSFINLHLRGKELGKVENSKVGLFSHPKVMLEMHDNKVFALTEGKDVFVNGEPLKPLIEKRELADRDRIGLGKDTDMAVYEYQANAVTAKQLRHEEEQASGIVRYTGAEKPAVVVNKKFIIDPKGIKVTDDQGGRQFSWNEFDEVACTADYDFIYQPTNNLGNAAGQGMVIGAQTATSTLESQKLSDLQAFFPAPLYKVEFFSKGASVVKLERVDQRACTMLDEGIDLFAPMDLVKFR